MRDSILPSEGKEEVRNTKNHTLHNTEIIMRRYSHKKMYPTL